MIRQIVATSKQAVRRLKNRFAHVPLILLYHRVAELQSDPQLLSVTQSHFAEHLGMLRQHAHPVALRDMVRGLRENNLPRRAVAVTFDDGYADNLHNAKPLLERHDVPATVYVTSGYVDSDREFMADQLEFLFLQPGTLPPQLSLTIHGRAHEWNLSNDARYDDAAYFLHVGWHVERAETPTTRHEVYRALCQLLYNLTIDEQKSVLNALFRWAGRELVCRPTHRALTSREVSLLASDGLVEVGSHTAEHPSLSSLPVGEQHEEISSSKARLEEMIGRPVNSFAYPFGTRSDYTAETVQMVRNAGYANACSNFPGLVRNGVDHWQLPRFIVRDWDGDEFARRLVQWWNN